MPKFTFIASNCLAFDGLTLEECPLGGTETAIIRLSESLADKGHQVLVYTKHPNPRSSNVVYKTLENFKDNIETDVLIAARDWVAGLIPAKAKRRFFWTGDAADQTSTYGIGDHRVAKVFDGLICVSAWQASTLSTQSGFPIEKTFVIRNGIHLPYFQDKIEKKNKSLIYSSTPYRGLYLIPELLNKLREKHPDLTIDIYSSYEVYGGSEGRDLQSFIEIQNHLKQIPGVYLHGSIKQADLAKAFLQSKILFYPNTFAETSCITAIEAQAAGCVVLSSDLGGLRETVGDCGVLIPGDPKSLEYKSKFIEAADALLSDSKLWQELSNKSVEKVAKFYSWQTIAENFESLTLS